MLTSKCGVDLALLDVVPRRGKPDRPSEPLYVADMPKAELIPHLPLIKLPLQSPVHLELQAVDLAMLPDLADEEGIEGERVGALDPFGQRPEQNFVRLAAEECERALPPLSRSLETRLHERRKHGEDRRSPYPLTVTRLRSLAAPRGGGN